MAEGGTDITLDIIMVVIAAVAAVLWNIGVIGSVINAGIFDPVMQVFLLVLFAVLLAEIYIVNTDQTKARLNRVFGWKAKKEREKSDDFYEKARSQRQREGGS